MTEKPTKTPLSFDEFRRLIAKGLQVEEEKVVGTASFVEDLHADSIQLVELMLWMEELGIEIPLESAWAIRTVEDAYNVYAQHARQGSA